MSRTARCAWAGVLFGCLAAFLVCMGLPLWGAALVCLLGVPVVWFVLDAVTGVESRRRIRGHVEATACPSCARVLGPSARWRVAGANHRVVCASCRAVCEFDRDGVLAKRNAPTDRADTST